jgi:gliding motility-associated-like protein
MCHRKTFTHFLFCLGLLLTAFSAKASHIIGAEVRYEHVTGRLYRVILNLYGDCNINGTTAYSQLATYNPPIRIYRDSTIFYRTLTLDRTLTPPQDVSPNCPSAVTLCYSTNSSVPGIKRFEYSDTITLPNIPSSCWRFEYNDQAQARSGRIQNLANNSSSPYIHSTLNNLSGITNTSPTFSTTATPYFCQSPNQQFNPGASDSVGDVLVYSLMDARTNGNTTVPYNSGYPAPHRLAVTSAPSFNSQTGQLIFSPSIQQFSTVVYRIEEYRNGVRVGSIMREMNFVVIPCTNSSPSANPSNPSTGTTVQNNTTISVCQGQTVSFNLNPTDPQNDTIDLTATGVPAGANYVITGNGTRTVTSNFSWNTTGVTPGTYNVVITYSDRACPISARQIVSYSIIVNTAPPVAYTLVSNPTCTAKGVFQLTFPSGNPASVAIRQGSTVIRTVTNPSGTLTDSLVAGTYTFRTTSSIGCTRDTTITLVAPSLPAVSATTTAVACFGAATGTATATATGGTTPYAYSWTGSPVQTTATAINLTAGTYTVTLTDANNCTATATATVTQPAAGLTAATTTTDVSCNGGTNGSATVTATGGTAPYTYSWNTTPVQTTATANNLSSGTYTATVTDGNGCTTTATASINQPAVLAATATQTPLSCAGGATGTATAAVTGGTAPYTYSWTTSPVQTTATASNLPSGTYTVTVTDSRNCTTTTATTIAPYTALALNATTTNTTCTGATGTATVTVNNGTAPYTYSWTTTPVQTTATAGSLAAGTYTVTVTDAKNCTATTTATVQQSGSSVTATSTQTPVSCFGGANGTATVTAAGGTGTYSYSWNTTPVQTTATATNLTSGTYTATVTDGNGCTATTTATITQPAALAVVPVSTAVSCFGGANGTATATTTGGTAPYTYSWTTTPVQTTATASNLTSGTYTATVTDAKGCTTTATVTVNQPTALTATTAKTDVSCNGGTNGSATVTPTGGTTPYTYSWNTTPVQTTATANNLTAGTYTVTVTDGKGCTTTATAVIAQPAALTISTTKTDVSCFGGTNGSATATVAGGNGGNTFSWNTTPIQTTATVNNLIAGTYTVTVTDTKGCTTTATATVGQPAALGATTVKTDASCFGSTNGTATVTVTGGNGGNTYSWNTTPVQTTPTATNLTAGTYTVTVTDSKGCTTTATATVGQPAALGAATVKTDATCFGSTNGTATVTVTGGNGGNTYGWNTTPVQTTPTATNLSAGTYTVTVTDSRGCTTTATATVGQPTAVTVTATKTDVSCFGGATGTATATATSGTAPYTYSWNTSPVRTTAAISGLTAGTYIVTATDAKGCTTTASITVTQPTASLTASTTTLPVSCFGGTNGSATATAAGGTLPHTYSWNTTPVQTTATANNLTSGTYTVTVTDTKGCTTTATATVGQPAALGAATVKTDATCFGSTNGTATVTVTGGNGGTTYSWNTTPVQTTPTATNLTAGTYTVTVTDSKGCTTIATATVGQPATGINISTASTAVRCNGGATGSATATITGGTGPYTLSWNTIPVQTTATASNLTAGTYTITVTDARNCSQTSSVVVTQPAALVATATQSDVLCNGGTTGSATVTATGGTAPYQYSWNTSPVQTTRTISNLASGTYIATITDANTCTTTQTVTIAEPAPLLNALTKTDLRCFDSQDGTATATVSGGTAPYQYRWDNNPALTMSNPTGMSAGTHVVVITDANRCTRTDTVVLLAPDPIAASLTIDSIPCFGQATGQIRVSTVQGGTGPYQYLWEDGSGSSDISHSGIASGTYTVRITDSRGCTQRFSQFLPEHPTMNVRLGTDTGICQGAQVALMVSGSADTWSWSPATGLSCTDCPNPVATPQQTTAYVVTGTNAFGCQEKDTIRIAVTEHRPVAVGPTVEVCAGQSTSLTASGGDAYAWNPSATLQNANTASPVATPAATTNYQVVISQNSCFKDTLYQQVVVNANPTINAGKDLRLFSGAQAPLQVEASSNARSIRWEPATNLSCADCWSPVLTALQSTMYVATVTTASGCQQSDSIRIQVVCDESPFYVANTFTPNGDGLDDWFYPQGVGAAKITRFTITNRWGQVVFENNNITPNDPMAGWNGYYKGAPMDSGVFMYLMELICASGEKVILKGDINLVR